MLIFFKHYRSSFRKAVRGFTLVELMVVSAIILLITAFVFFQQNKFNSATLLRSLTYGVALSMRQAQTYGTSVRESSAGSGIFAAGYGVYFSSGDLAHYYLFPDFNPTNGQYDNATEGPPSGIQYTLGRGTGVDYRVSNICVLNAAALNCYSGTSPTITWFVVYFRRPNPDACFATDQAPNACAPSGAQQYSAAYVTLTSVGNFDTRTVKISTTGQISVCKANELDLMQC